MSKETKPRSLSVDQLIKRLQEDNADLIRQRDALQQRVVGLMQQSVMNCAMGLYVREPSMSAEKCFAAAYEFTKYADTFLADMPEVKEQFQATDADKPAKEPDGAEVVGLEQREDPSVN